MRLVLSAILKHLGVTVYETSDAVGAAHLLRKLSFEVDGVLCGSSLPRITGRDFLKHFKSVKNLRGIPFLLIVGQEDRPSLSHYVRDGVDGLLHKPVSEGMLRCAISALKGLPLTIEPPPPLLSILPPKPASTLMESATVRQLSEGVPVFVAGSPPQQMALILEGEVRAGEEVWSAGEAVALEEFLSSTPLKSDALTTQPSRIALITRPDVEALSVESEEFCYAVAKSVAPPSVEPLPKSITDAVLTVHACCATGVLTCGDGVILFHGGVPTSIHHPETDDPSKALTFMKSSTDVSFRPEKTSPEIGLGISPCNLVRRLF